MVPVYESTCSELYDSAVLAFPHTTRRQHVTHTIDITGLNVVPFVGVKTLFLRADVINEGRSYRPMILVKGVEYYKQLMPGVIEITGSDGAQYYLEQPSVMEDDVLLRCGCPDFFWRFNYYDHLDKSLYGRKRKRYEAKLNPGSANPLEMPGMCKHLMKMVQTLNESGLFVT
jgi:hypothetical protein